MTLDEAILHCEEVMTKCTGQCYTDHAQLASWLRELKAFRNTGALHLNEKPLTEPEVIDRRQYWCSKMCNSVDVDSHKIYEDLFKAYDNLYNAKYKKK